MKIRKAIPAKAGTAVTVAPANALALPPEWEAQLAESAKEASAMEAPEVTSFSLRAGVLSYNDQPMPNNEVDVIVVASAFEKAYYINKFDPSNIVSPACFALAENGDGMHPHEHSFQEQNETCLNCPMSEWGSDPNSPSKRGKACKETRRLAVIPATALEEGLDKAAIALVKVSVTNVANWSDYVHKLATTAKRPPWSVVTKIKVSPNPTNVFSIEFSPVEPINDPNTLEMLQTLRERGAQAAMVPYGMMTEEQFKELTTPKPVPAAAGGKRKF